MIEHRLVSEPQADLDIETTFRWYKNEQSGLGLEFLAELRATYDRRAEGPLKSTRLVPFGKQQMIPRLSFPDAEILEDAIQDVLGRRLAAQLA